MLRIHLPTVDIGPNGSMQSSEDRIPATSPTITESQAPRPVSPDMCTHPKVRDSGEDPLKGRLAMSVRETAMALGLSDKTIRRLIDRGLLRASRSLRHILIPRTEIDRFLKSTLDLTR